MSCPHSRIGRPDQCSQCIGVAVARTPVVIGAPIPNTGPHRKVSVSSSRGGRSTAALHPKEPQAMIRGLVLPLSMDDIAARARALGTPTFIDGYYRLDYPYNSSPDPNAADPFYRWSKPGEAFVNRTGDCVSGACWSGGWDRFQPVRAAHIPGYRGELNCDSILWDATGPAKCFVVLLAPVPGCFLVAPTGAPGFEKCGHIWTCYSAPPVSAWSIDDEDCWRHCLGTDIAARGANRANQSHDATWWFAARHHGAQFVKSIMVP